MNKFLSEEIRRAAAGVAAFAITIAIGLLVVMGGVIPSAFTTLFFFPIFFAGWRYPLPASLGVAALAPLFRSPAMELAGVTVDRSVLPLLWLGWPAAYLFLAVSAHQWPGVRRPPPPPRAPGGVPARGSAPHTEREEEAGGA